MKLSTPFILLIIFLLTACASPSSATPTPTIVRLERSALAEATATTGPVDPTATTAVVTEPATVTPAATVTPTAMATASAVQVEVVTTAVYLRAGPGMSYEVIGSAQAGDQLAVTGISASGGWLQIVTPTGEPGWISALADYTRLISAETSDLPVIEAAATPAGVVTSAVLTASGSDSAGGRLIFATASGGDLYAVNADGTDLQKLASGVIDPVVSPDGTQVAFTRWDAGELGTLYVLDLASGSERAILGETLQAKSPTWSPDGQSIVVSFQQGGLRNPQEECHTYDRDDGMGVPRGAEITKTHYKDDGSVYVCFIRREDLQWLLRQVEVASGSYEDLPVDLYSFSPAWDPQNAWRVIYDGDKGLMQFDLNSGSNIALTTDLRDTAPVFSPDGQTLALTYKQHDHWEVYTYDLASGSRVRLTKPPILADPQYSSAAPAWSPDGSHIAFVTDRSGHWEIWVMNADGSAPRPLFSTEVQAQLGLHYNGVNERLLNWIE